MTIPTISKALLVDSNTRRADEISKALRRAQVEVIVRREAVDNSGAGCGVENLWSAKQGLPQFDVLFIHLGPLAPERDRLMYGNQCAMEFVLHHFRALEQRCIVAYSGGESLEPREFSTVRKADWHRFFENVNGGAAFQIAPFIYGWRSDPLRPPPFDLLTQRCKALETFKRLTSDYRVAYAAARTPEAREKLSQRERPERWRNLFADNSAANDLLKRLEWAGDNEGLRAATALRSWLTVGSDPSPGFDDELRNAILSMRPWAPPPRGNATP
jgi:hypothetical protein